MTQKNTGGPAFPHSTIDGHTEYGMTLRDYFAIHAPKAEVEHLMDWQLGPDFECHPKHTYAEASYLYADAMLAARGDAA